jgi:ATP-dependent DNA helicase RecQ
MYAFCQQAVCRHRALVTYFGQTYDRPSCGACDVCLGETVAGADTSGAAARILEAVAELRGRFGATHVTDVLVGAATGRISQLHHDRLAAYGTLRGETKARVRGWIDQLLAHGLLARSDDEYPTVVLTEQGRAVLRGDAQAPALTSAAAVRATAADASGVAASATEPAGADTAARAGAVAHAGARAVADPATYDRVLFEALRVLRRTIAEERGVPPYVVFSDASLRDMARLRPRTREAMLEVKGVGEWKYETFGDRFLTLIRQQT